MLFWLTSRRRGRPCRHGFLGGVSSVPCVGRWRAASLYALLTGFRAPAPPRVRFVAARRREARTVRLVVVFVGVGVFRRERCRVFGARGSLLERFACVLERWVRVIGVPVW